MNQPEKEYRPKVKSRHPSHDILRGGLPMLPVKSVIRLGSVTIVENTVSKGGNVIEINTIDAVKNSANKLLMKQCFQKANISTADWFIRKDDVFLAQKGLADQPEAVATDELPYPLIAKHVMGSRGTGNYKFDSEAELLAFLEKGRADNFIFERYYNYGREYRIHMTADGYFYTCRKMLKRDAPKDEAWQRHDNNCTWFVEENPGFDKPVNWDEIIGQCKLALEAVGLDIASFDVRVQSTKVKEKPREKCEFIIIECNSASSFGKVTGKKYLKELPKLIMKKAEEYGLKPKKKK